MYLFRGTRVMDDSPRIVVWAGVLIRRDQSVLLVRQGYGEQYWSLPGGVMEPGESIDRAAVREVQEETGLQVRVRRVVGLYSKPDEGALAVTFEGEVVGGILRADHEITDCRYFPFDELPKPIREHLRRRVDDFRRELPYTLIVTQ